MKKNKVHKMKGDDIYENIVWWLHHIPHTGTPIKPNFLQQIFHEKMLQAFLPLIYGDDFERNRDIILRKYNIVRHNSMLLIMVSRRMGKTLGTVMMLFAILMALPGASIDVYAQSLDFAKVIVKKVRGLCMLLKDKHFVVTEDNKTTFEIHIKGEAELKDITARSSEVKVSLSDLKKKKVCMLVFFPFCLL